MKNINMWNEIHKEKIINNLFLPINEEPPEKVFFTPQIQPVS